MIDAVKVPEVVADKSDRGRSLSDGCGDAFARAIAHITRGEDAGHARLEEQGLALEWPTPLGTPQEIRPREKESVVVAREHRPQPLGTGAAPIRT